MARPLTVTAIGGANLTTSVKKFGSASLDNTSSNSIAGAKVSADTSLDVGNGTIAFSGWFYLNSVGGNQHFFSQNNGNGNVWFCRSQSGEFLVDVNLNGNNYRQFLGSIPVGYPGWFHLELAKLSTGDVILYIDGAKYGSFLDSYGSITPFDWGSGGDLYIGTNDDGTGQSIDGYIDEVRIVNSHPGGTSITRPTQAYTNTDNTLFLCHFDGANLSTTLTDTYNANGSANLSASFAVDRADGRTFLRANANLEAFATELAVQNPSPSMVYLQNDVFTWADTDTWDTIYDSDDKWAVWERLNASFSITAIGSDFDIASSQQFGEFTLSAKGGLEQNGNARLEDAFTQTAKGGLLIGIDDPYDYTWDTIPEDQWNSFFTDQWRPDGWFAFDAVTLTANGGLALAGASTLEANSTVTVDARLSDVRASADLNSTFTQGNVDARTFLRASADLNSEFTLASGSDNSKDGSATLEAFAAEVTVGRLSDVRASADLVSQFTLASGSDLYRNASSTLEAEAILTSSSGVTLVNAANLDSQFALESQSRILKLANLDITSLGDMTVAGVMTLNAVSSLEGEFTQAASAGYSLSGSANLAAEFTEIVHATLIPSVELDEVAFNADLTASGVMTFNAGAQLEAFAAEITVGQRIQGAKANLEAEFTSIVAGTATLAGQARLDAFVSQLSAGRISDIRGSATLAGTFAAEFAGELKLLDSQFIYMVLNENRTFGIESEIRKYDVLPENRLFGIDPESRLYQVLPENRTVDVGYFMQ